LHRLLPQVLERPELSALFRGLLKEMAGRLRLLEERRRHYDQLIARAFAQDARCQRLGQIEGIGPMTATPLVRQPAMARASPPGAI
jgi:transposase